MKYKNSVLFVILLFFACLAYSQYDSINYRDTQADTLHENSRLFDSDELIPMSLRFDITQYKRKRNDKDYMDAILTYYTSSKDSINRKIKLRARGEFRREFCDFPPFLLNFKMQDSTQGEFSWINKLKMVTQCNHGSEEVLLKEYLTYKLYNVITDNSFRVRLLRVNYINTSRQNKSVTEYAFVIEPIDLLAKRLNSVEIRTTNLTQRKIKPEMMDRMAIFNYMIGNTDWSVQEQHNILILAQPESERPDLGVIIPFDFDFSGLVGTNYSAPFEGLKIKSVRDRLYLGTCRSEEALLNALSEFSEKKEEFYKVINEFLYLNEKSKKEMTSYLDEFFKGFDDRNTLLKKLLYECTSY